MKVLQLTKFYPPVTGGIEAVAKELTDGLRDLGVRCDVLCANTGMASVVERLADQQLIVRSGSFGKLLSTSISPSLLYYARRMANSYDIIHVHLPNPLANLALFLARTNCKIVTHWHNDIVRQQLALRIYAPLQEWLLRRSSAIIATSDAYAKSSEWLTPHHYKVAVIPIGISSTWNPSIQQAANNIAIYYGRKDIVFACGRMTYYKGFEYLIEAARDLPENCVVVIAGGGEQLEPHRKRVLELNLQHRVHLIGPLRHQDTVPYYAAAKVFCLPSTSRAESFGVVLLEAMAMSKPIVATRIVGSGVTSVNSHGVTGINVQPRSSAELATAIRTLLHNPLVASAMGAAAYNRFATHFTATKMVQSVAALYSRIADQRC